MPMPVLLREVIDGIDVPDESQAFLNRKTGEVYMAMEDELSLDEDEDEDDVAADDNLTPAWQRQAAAKAREILEAPEGEWVRLPTKFDFDEYRVMERFCLAVDDERMRDDLLDAIKGGGAFRRFKDMVHRLDIAERWYDYRNRALSEFATKWLEAEGIPYQR
jgi:hypothetical protein